MESSRTLRSITSILDISSKVVGYLRVTNDSQTKRMSCFDEVKTLHNLLTQLYSRVKDTDPSDPWCASVLTLTLQGNVFDRTKRKLQQLDIRLSAVAEMEGVRERASWPFEREEIASIRERIGRTNDILGIGVTSGYV